MAESSLLIYIGKLVETQRFTKFYSEGNGGNFRRARQSSSCLSDKHALASSSILFGDEQIFSEGPLIVDPLCFAAESGDASRFKDFFERIFVAALSPDSFAFEELDGNFGGGNLNRLITFRAKVHFNAASCVVDPGKVLELREIKIGVEFAIDAGEQVEVERGSYAEFVIVGCEQLRL